ncbi:MAG: glycosyltransferase family 39 protein [Dehalococcoidia bacterium]
MKLSQPAEEYGPQHGGTATFTAAETLDSVSRSQASPRTTEPEPTHAQPSSVRDLAIFGFFGLALLALFGSLVARFPLLHYFPGPGVTISFYEIFGRDWVQGSWWYITTFTAAFLLLGGAALAVPKQNCRRTVALTFALPVLFASTLAYMYPITAMDVIHYYAESRILWVYHQNPLTVPVMAHPFIVGVSFPDVASPYGPLWQILTGPTTLLAGKHWAWGVLGLKLVAGLAYLVCAWIIYLIVRRLRPERALTAVVLFAWNPFIVFRVAGNGHNDISMVVFILLAIYCVVSERWRWIFPTLAASVLIKYISLLLAPLFFLYLLQLARQRRDRSILVQSAVGLLIAGLLSLSLFAIFWAGTDTFTALQRTSQPLTSTPLVFAAWLTGKVRPGSELASANWFLRVAFAALYCQILLFSRPRPERLISGCVFIFVGYVFLVTPWFRPWYFLWFVPLTVLQPSRWYLAFGLVSSLTVNLAEQAEYYRTRLDWFPQNNLALISAPVIVQFLLPALLLLVSLLITRSPDLRRRRDADTALPDPPETDE